MGYNQGNDIRSEEKQTDIFHPDICPIQINDTAFRHRYGISGISQVPRNLVKLEIKMVQIPQNNANQTFKAAIYIH